MTKPKPKKKPSYATLERKLRETEKDLEGACRARNHWIKVIKERNVQFWSLRTERDHLQAKLDKAYEVILVWRDQMRIYGLQSQD